MRDFAIKNKLKKKVFESWENESGKPVADDKKAQIETPPKMRKMRKNRWFQN